jgi:hypothetical protein
MMLSDRTMMLSCENRGRGLNRSKLGLWWDSRGGFAGFFADPKLSIHDKSGPFASRSRVGCARGSGIEDGACSTMMAHDESDQDTGFCERRFLNRLKQCNPAGVIANVSQ